MHIQTSQIVSLIICLMHLLENFSRCFVVMEVIIVNTHQLQNKPEAMVFT